MPTPPLSKFRSAFYAFLFLTALAAGFLGAALALGTEPRLVLERTGPGAFRVTGSNHFAGRQYFSKTVEGVKNVIQDDAVRDGRRDSEREQRKRRQQKHLELTGATGAKCNWDRESDASLIDAFMGGQEPRLALADPPPLWRMSLAWFLAGFGGLTFLAAVQSFFPKKTTLQRLPVQSRRIP